MQKERSMQQIEMQQRYLMSKIDQSSYSMGHRRSNTAAQPDTSMDLAYHQEMFLRIAVGHESMMMADLGREPTPSNIAPSLNNTQGFERQEIHSLALRVK